MARDQIVPRAKRTRTRNTRHRLTIAGRHGDHRVLRGRADEAYRALLHGGQNASPTAPCSSDGIRPAADRSPVRPYSVRRSFARLEHLAHVGHAAGHGVELHERCAGGPRDYRGQRGLAASRAGRRRWTTGQPVGLDGAPEAAAPAPQSGADPMNSSSVRGRIRSASGEAGAAFACSLSNSVKVSCLRLMPQSTERTARPAAQAAPPA